MAHRQHKRIHHGHDITVRNSSPLRHSASIPTTGAALTDVATLQATKAAVGNLTCPNETAMILSEPSGASPVVLSSLMTLDPPVKE